MFTKSIFLLFLFGFISNQINCFYYGDKQDTDQKTFELLANELFKSELDEKVNF